MQPLFLQPLSKTKNQIKEFLYFIEYFNEETIKDMRLFYCNMFLYNIPSKATILAKFKDLQLTQ